MKDIELAWFAGLFEGEGWFGVSYSKTVPGAARVVTLGLGSTDEDVIERIHALMGGTRKSRRIPNHRIATAKPFWTWQLAKREEVKRVVPMLMPWFSARRSQQAETAMDALAVWEQEIARRRDHCKRGHRYDRDGVYIDPAGRKHCTVCRLDAQRARIARAAG